MQDVLTGAVFAYGFVASFILACLQKNLRTQRSNAPALAVVGWGLMSASFAMAALLMLLAAEMTLLR